MARRPASRPTALGELVPRVLDEAGLSEASLGVRLVDVWEEALGAELAPHCRPEGIRRGTLQAIVRDSAWMQRLQMEKPRVLAALAEALGEHAPADLRLRIGALDAHS